MTIEEIANLVEGTIVCGESFKDQEVECALASDLMSDVLTTHTDKKLLLITGLSNLQAIRTCEMSDITMILVVRGKEVTPEMIELAEDNDILIVTTKYSLYRATGILYGEGLPSVY